MIEVKATRKDEGVDVTIGLDGMIDDLGLEALYIIANLMREIKKADPRIHRAMIVTMAGNEEIMLGNVIADNEDLMSKGVS